MTITKTILLASAILCFVACSKSEKQLDSSAMDITFSGSGGGTVFKNAEMESSDAPTDASIPKKVTEQKLIKNGSISFETKSIKDTKAFLQKTILKYKGYISNENIQDYRTNPTEVLVVRVPNTDFDNLINEIGQQVGEFDSKQISIEDVTAEFVDIEARLKNKKQLEGKYQELLSKASNMADILKIEKEISLIREDIEATEGRLRYLSNQVGYSTLNITYYEKKATAGFHFGDKLGDAVTDGGMGFLWFLIGLTHLWPMLLIGAIIWYSVYKLIKRRRNRQLNQKTSQ